MAATVAALALAGTAVVLMGQARPGGLRAAADRSAEPPAPPTVTVWIVGTTFVPISALGGGAYSFLCLIHPSMTGTLLIDGPPDGTITDLPKFDQPLAHAPPRRQGTSAVGAGL